MRFLRLDSDEAVASLRRLPSRPASSSQAPASRPDLREPAPAAALVDSDPTDPIGPDAAEAGSSAPDPLAELLAGCRIVGPAVLAVLPLGLALGVLVVQSGFAWWWAPIIAAIVFAGSMEFLLVGLLAAAAPLSQIAMSTLLVNFRHVFYALSFPLHRMRGRLLKAYSTFSLTDEAYALTAGRQARSWTQAKILGIQLLFHLGWVLFVAAGAGLGLLIPIEIPGLDFAVTALVVVLALEGYRAQRSLPAPVLAVVCGLVGLLISPENMLVIAMGLFTLGLLAAYAIRARRGRG